MRAEAVVVGGGLVGSSVAYNLSKEGLKVVLLEKRGISLGTSGACGSLVSLHTKRPGIHLELARRSIGELKDFQKEFQKGEFKLPSGLECKETGSVMLGENQNDEEIMCKIFVRAKRSGINIKTLDREELMELVPIVSNNVIGANYVPSDLTVNPINLNIGFLEMAKRHGVEVHLGIAAKKILLDKNKDVKCVLTSHGKRIKTDLVVNAAGVEAPEVARMVGIVVPIKPRRGQRLVFERAPPHTLNVYVLGAKGIATKLGLLESMDKEGLEQGIGLGACQMASGHILTGSTREFVGYDKSNSFDGIVGLAREVIRLLPGLRRLQVIRTYSGLRPYTKDGLPVIGYVENVGGFIMAAGHGGDGITLSSATGKLVAELVISGRTSIPLERLSLERFRK